MASSHPPNTFVGSIDLVARSCRPCLLPYPLPAPSLGALCPRRPSAARACISKPNLVMSASPPTNPKHSATHSRGDSHVSVAIANTPHQHKVRLQLLSPRSE